VGLDYKGPVTSHVTHYSNNFFKPPVAWESGTNLGAIELN
jgi:hypothetical protein